MPYNLMHRDVNTFLGFRCASRKGIAEHLIKREEKKIQMSADSTANKVINFLQI